MRVEYHIVLLDTNEKRWPPIKKLVELGVPLKVVEHYARERRAITSGLRRRVRESVN